VLVIRAERIRDYGPNFALYRVDPEFASEINVLEENGPRAIRLPENFNGIVGVREIDFAGWAKGKTGRHALNENATSVIEIAMLRVGTNGKVSAGKWFLADQEERDRLYQQRLFESGVTAGNHWGR